MLITKVCAHLFYGIVIGLLLVLLPGCLGVPFERHAPLIQLTVQAATARVLEERPEWADDVVKVTEQTLTYMDGTDQVTVEALASHVKEQIPWSDLLPEEKALISTLLDVVQAEVEVALKDQGVPDPGKVKVVVSQVLLWIHEMALYVS